jgi:pyrrolidone-carboxylate peptidase
MVSSARRILAITSALLVLGALAPAPSSAAPPNCFDETVSPTVEEGRLTQTLGNNREPVAAQIIRRTGFDAIARAFEVALCDAPSRAAVGALVDGFGLAIWEEAVDRARHPGGGPASALPGDDDRGLYWTRLTMALALRQFKPPFRLSAADRAELQRRLEYASRGITSTDFTRTVKKLLVSGFDPFLLDDEIRRSNPSGAAVLRLDGRVLNVGGTRVEVQAVVFPVRYADFDRGIVEAAFRPHLRGGRQGVDMFSTVSQGRPGAFDLEVWNGRRRSVDSIGDNNNVLSGGSPAAPVVFPGVAPGPEFVPTTLPHQAMLAANGRPFPVRRNPSVVEIPAGSTTPVTRPNGPTPGSIASSGSGGGYLSNESAYRTTLLRDILGARLPGGHVHTPVLVMDPANLTRITDPVFEKNRTDIGTQVELIRRLGVATLA